MRRVFVSVLSTHGGPRKVGYVSIHVVDTVSYDTPVIQMPKSGARLGNASCLALIHALGCRRRRILLIHVVKRRYDDITGMHTCGTW